MGIAAVPGFLTPPLPSEKLMEELRNWGKMVTAVVALAELKTEADYNIEGFALYVHALSVVRAALLTAQRRVVSDGISTVTPDPGLREAVEFLRAKLGETLAKAERIRGLLSDSDSTAAPEKLIYEHALFLAREGAVAEQTGQKPKSRSMYETSIALLESIVPSVPDRDKATVRKYITMVKKRLVASTSTTTAAATATSS
jgi:hypothetical protein